MTRIEGHPIVRKERGTPFTFTFAGKGVSAYPGETIASALFAGGIRVFGHHPKDGAPQGLFCANGQCSQCMVLADGLAVKACMTPATVGLHVEPLDGLPHLPPIERAPEVREPERKDVSVLVLGGGPAGLSAAIELGSRGVDVLVVDDKDRLGGKLVLQTHRFFGSIDAVHAGTRGIDIASRLEGRVRDLPSVEVWLDSAALAVFSDGLVGILHGATYAVVRPRVLLVATGAREKSLVFKGNTLPGVYGAGAFQTLVNRDLVRAAERLFIVGGGNVGLIAGYHALQAGIDVVGLVEALPECGGYKVHKDKLARMGVPIYTSHTILSANGAEGVESVTIAAIDKGFRPIPGTERSFACDTVLIAVGLDPVDEFHKAAAEFGLPVYAAGDAEEIAEASAAIFAGKIRGLEIARALGATIDEVPAAWSRMGEILKSKPGPAVERASLDLYLGGGVGAVYPVFHCSQEIPCNPCTSVCPQKLIAIDEADLRRLPEFRGAEGGKACVGCERCVAICPGLAITLVDERGEGGPIVTVPFEFPSDRLSAGNRVMVSDDVGTPLGEVSVLEVKALPKNDRTVLVRVRVSRDIATRIAGIRVQEPWISQPLPEAVEPLGDDAIVCRCERVTAGEIRACIREGYRDMNEIKIVTRAGMGACGGKTCTALIQRLFREEGVSLADVTENVRRPLFVEVPLGVLAGASNEGVGRRVDAKVRGKGAK
ncbi:MAG: FAD-dependent oxidoreductase [Candidatus Bipolaricaulota bacterium]|nr:FAD-dependent oxidoreductase [Candidatus Bipolaricaulota bacterium]